MFVVYILEAQPGRQYSLKTTSRYFMETCDNSISHDIKNKSGTFYHDCSVQAAAFNSANSEK